MNSKIFEFFIGLLLLSILGIANSQTQWKSLGPDGGDLFGIHTAPDNPSTLYALSYFGIFQSTDSGNNWIPIHHPKLGHGFVSLVHDPQDAKHLFIATRSKGVWTSPDDGKTWSACGEELPHVTQLNEIYYPITSLAIHSDGSLFAGIGELENEDPPAKWIYRSNNNCSSWTSADIGISGNLDAVSQEVVVLLSIDIDKELWAAVHGAGIYKYDNGVWENANGNLSTDGQLTTFLVHDPKDSSRLLSGTERDWIYESVDSGVSWTRLPLPDALTELNPLPLVYNIAIDPTNTDLVYVLALDDRTAAETPLFSAEFNSQTKGMAGYISSDGGQSWTTSANLLLRVAFDKSQTIETILPLHGQMLRSKTWYGTSFGVNNLLKSMDGAVMFKAANKGISSVLTNTIWLHPSPTFSADKSVLIGAEESLAFLDNGSWRYKTSISKDIDMFTWSFADDQQNSNSILYSTGHPARHSLFERGIYRTTLNCFGGECPPDTQILTDTGVWRVLTHPDAPQDIYAATQDDGVLLSQDGGLTWSAMNNGLSLPKSITDIAFDTLGNPLLASVRQSNGNITAVPPQAWGSSQSESGNIYRWGNGSWSSVLTSGGAVYDLDQNPYNPDHYLAATASGIYESTDAGLTWLKFQVPSVVTNVVLFDPNKINYCYAAGLYGVVRSTDGGATWHNFSDGLINKHILSLSIDAESGKLYAATLGGSVYTLVPDSNAKPEIDITPGSLVFDSALVGFPGSNKYFTITNNGEADLIISDITSDNASFSLLETPLPLTLAPRNSAAITVQFSPESEGTHIGELAFNSNAIVTPVVVLSISGEGRLALPAIPDVKLNGGDTSLSLPFNSRVELTASLSAGDYLGHSADFWLRWTLPDGRIAWLVAGRGWVYSETPQLFLTTGLADIDLLLAFKMNATLTGQHEINFTIDNNADGKFDSGWTDVVRYIVAAQPPVMITVPDEVDLGTMPVVQSGHGFFHIVNGGESDLVIDTIEVSDSMLELVELPVLPITINSGKNVPIVIKFTPSKTGNFTGQISVTGNDPVSPSSHITIISNVQEAKAPILDIDVNASDGPVSIAKGDSALVSISIEANDYSGLSSELWIWWDRWDVVNKQWIETLLATFPATYFNLNNSTLFDASVFPAGKHRLRFEGDLLQDGNFGPGKTFTDSVDLIIE